MIDIKVSQSFCHDHPKVRMNDLSFSHISKSFR